MNSSMLWLLSALILLCLKLSTAKRYLHHQHHHRQQEQQEQQCFSLEELKDMPASLMGLFVGSHVHWDRYTAVNKVQVLEKMQDQTRRRRSHQENSCPNLALKSISQADPSGRSISPWRYRIDSDANRYPEKLAFAECLCTGCINDQGQEVRDMNSVLLKTTMMVLRRKPCLIPGKFTFKVDYIQVPVGCTCVVPRS